MHSEMFILIY